MARKESFSVGVLSLSSGIRAGKRRVLQKVLKFFVGTPAAIVANRFVTTTNMIVGAYTVANSGLPGDGLAHNVSVTHTEVGGGVDTLGYITFTGLDLDGKVITENVTPLNGTVAYGTKAFAQVTSVVGVGWVIGVGNDTIVCGFGETVGIPDYLANTADVLMVAFTTALVNAPTVAVSSSVLASNTVLVPTGDGTKKLRVLYQV